jgi:HAD superfamily hydrolase (TIGR01509 family)
MTSDFSPYLKHLYVCVNQRQVGEVCCAASRSEAICQRLKAYVKEHGLSGRVRVSSSGCMGLCAQGPNVMVYPGERWYSHVTLETVEEIIARELAPWVKGRCSSEGKSQSSIPIQALLFDLGNVLVRFDHRKAANRLVDGTGTDPERFVRFLFDSPLIVAHDEGRISTFEFYTQLCQIVHLKVPYEQFLSVWNDIFQEDPKMNRLLVQCLDRLPCYLISNTNRAHFEHVRKMVPLLDRMAGWILSYEVGHLKPHPVIYHRALEMARLPAESILYIDDRDDLIEAARRLGFRVHRFTQADLFQNELLGLGILEDRG